MEIRHLHLRLFFVILFIFAPKIIAFLIPTSYIYHWQNNPILMDKQEFKICEPITWTLKRKSLIPFKATVTERIIDGSPVADRSYRSAVMATEEYKTVKVIWDNLCLKPDVYNLEGVIEFDFLGVTKSYVFNSLKFNVVEIDKNE